MKYIKILISSAVLLLSAQHLNAQCIALSSGPGSDNQTVCINTSITTIVYTLASSVTGVTVTGLPTGVSGLYNSVNETFTISGTPSVSGSFTYVVTTSGCAGVVSGFIIVNQNSTITLTSGPTTTSQTVCINKPIANITYLIGGGGTGATVTGLPTGVTGTYSSSTFTISGTPSVTGTFNYIVTTNGPCTQASATGTIQVNPDASITLTSGAGTNSQTVCINNPITAITYSVSGGGTGASASGLPTGVTGLYSGGVFTISGTPSVSGTFTYTVTTTGTCMQATANGTITVNANSTITLSSGNGTNIQSHCINTAITNITYSIGGGGTGASATGLPTGVAGSYSSGTFTISGTPTLSGIYNYTVTTTGPCVQASASGTLTVNPNAAITLTSASGTNNQTVCANTSITGITYSITGGGTGAGVTGLPAGVTGTYSSGVFTISGIPTATGTFSYTVTTTGTCTQATATGTIIVVLNAGITLTSAAGTSNQTVCVNSAITNITYSVSGGGTGAGATGLPTGVTGSYSGGIFTISGTPSVPGIFNYTVTTTGTCTQAIATGTITVVALPVATASNNGPVCVGSALSLTGGPNGMTTYAWTGPNSFTSILQNPTVSTAATTAMAGVYILTVTNANGCRDTASTRAYVYAVPVVNAGTGGSVCDLNFTLNAVPSVGTGLWTLVTGPGTATFSPNANTAGAIVTVSAYGTYTFRWTETNGPCSGNAVITVDFYQQPVANAGTGGNECDLNFTFNAVPSVGTGLWTLVTGPGTATFSPNANTPGAIVTVSAYGTYTFRWTETNGTCTSNATVIVNFYQQPVANAGTGSSNNCGEVFNFTATPSVGTGTWTKVSGPGTATFSPNANIATAKVTVTAYGTYTFKWTEVNGTCSNSASISVAFIQQPSADGGAGGDVCGKTFALNAVAGIGTSTWSFVDGPGTATFTPDASHANATVTVSAFGGYDFAWTIVNSQCTSSDIIRVTFHDLPAVNAGSDTAVCKGSSIQLNATGTGTFLWKPANLLNNATISNPVATPVTSTVFTVTLTDQWGCKNSDDVNVEVRAIPVANAGPDQLLEYIFETNLEGSALSADQTGEWTVLSGTGEFTNPNDPLSAVKDLSLGINSFIWTVSNGVCQSDADTVIIKVNNLIIPTLITPNSDGKNDYFVINGIETLGSTSLLIFNRWGAKVFENPKYDNKWNGVDDKNRPLPEDTYFFILRPEKSKAISGYVVIRR